MTLAAPAGEAARKTPSGARRVGLAVAGLAASVGCLYLAMRGADLAAVGRALADANLWLALPLLAAQVVFYAIKAIRWRLLLAPIRDVESRRLVAPMMIGFMGNNLLPARLGELIRMYLGARLLRVPHAQVLATLVLERLFDFIAVLALFAAGAAQLHHVPPSLVSAGYVSAALSGVAIALTAAYATWTAPMLRLAALFTRPLPSGLAGAVHRQLELLASALGALRRPRLLAGIVVASLLQWLLMSLCIYLSCLAVGASAPAPAAVVVLAATVFGVMIPAAPGFFGTLHLAFVLALTPFDVGESRAMAAAVFYHIIPYVSVTLVGIWFVRQTGLRLQEIERDALDMQSAGSAQ